MTNLSGDAGSWSSVRIGRDSVGKIPIDAYDRGQRSHHGFRTRTEPSGVDKVQRVF